MKLAPFVLAFIILSGVSILANVLSTDGAGRVLSFSLVAGAAFGIVLQRGRFCFFCNFRDFVERRIGDGLISILVALGAGLLLYQIVIMAWMPVPHEARLPSAHIGPVGLVLAFSSLVFGLGMSISGSCLSAHFYRLGEGSFGCLAALSGAALGFLVGFLSWNSIYSIAVFDDPPVWLPHHLGYAGTVLVSMVAIVFVAIIVLRLARPQEYIPSTTTGAIFSRRWPPVLTGLLVAIISAFTYLRVSPLGVTAELGSLVRTVGTNASLLPETLVGLDTVRACISALKTSILSPNGLFVSGIVLGSFSSALAAGQFNPSWPSPRGVAVRLVGGALMCWASVTALGCTVGVLLSGIHAGALSGWIFLLFCSLGIWLGLKLPQTIRA
ncbi:MAG: YeeE/YedE family protein [Rhizobium pusense]|nr:YeeE/YedE family protein [Agrobacterium pusense]